MECIFFINIIIKNKNCLQNEIKSGIMHHSGKLAERSKAAVLKTVLPKGNWGSNP